MTKKTIFLWWNPQRTIIFAKWLSQRIVCAQAEHVWLLDHYRRLKMKFKIFKVNSPVHKRVTLDIQTFNTVLGTSFTFSLLSLFLALSPCQTQINRKTPQLQASLLGLSGLPIPNCQKGSGHKSAQMLLKPVAGIDVNLPPVASSHAFLPCFSTSSMLTSFFNSNPAFSTLIQLFQLQSCFSNPEWLK